MLYIKMSNLIRNHTIFINSSGRVNGEIYNGKYILDQRLFAVPNDVKIHFHLLQFQCKASFPYIRSINKTFTYTEGGTPYTITLTEATYTASQLATEIQTQLNASGGGITWTVSYLEKKNKYQYTKSTGDANITFTFDSSTQTHKLLGFDRSTGLTMNSGTTTIESNNLISIGNPLSCNIHISKCNVAEELSGSRGEHITTILASVPILCPKWGVIFYSSEGTHNYEWISNAFDTPDMIISLLDENGNYLPVEDDFQLVLRLEYVQKDDFSTNDLLKLMVVDKPQIPQPTKSKRK